MSGTLAHSPAEIIVDLLIGQSLGTQPSDKGSWPIFQAIAPDNPDSIVTVTDTASIKQGRYQYNGETQEHFGVQIAVRSANYLTGWAKANAIKVAIDGITNTGVVIGSDGYIVYALSHNGIISLGKNVTLSKRNLFTINPVCAIRQDV